MSLLALPALTGMAHVHATGLQYTEADRITQSTRKWPHDSPWPIMLILDGGFHGLDDNRTGRIS